ncbi:hypothetical protein GCM10020295_75610 [Streptomyces cinereospinus]
MFDGRRLTEPRTVVIDGGTVSRDTRTAGARTVDGTGMTLLPGLIDAHVHLHGPDTLARLAAHGVTTALDMATWPPATPRRPAPGTGPDRHPQRRHPGRRCRRAALPHSRHGPGRRRAQPAAGR